MEKECKNLFGHFELVEPPAGLFEKIILAIKREKELQQRRRLLFGFFFLLITSFIGAPFSLTLLVEQVKNSGILYFLSTAFSDLGLFLTLWQDFILAILESLPIMGIVVFMVNIAILLFTLRLFLYRKRLLLNYLINYGAK